MRFKLLKKLPISVSIIANEEARRITRALESVSGWASEIIVVINEESADGTAEIAERYGAKVFREPWKGHIGQKNSAAAKATQEWVFGLDSDEEISKELQEELQRAFHGSANRTGLAAYRMPRCTQYYGRWIRHGDWYPDRKVRLWRRGKGKWGGIDPHDKIEVEGLIGDLKGDILHYTAETINHQFAKTMAYAGDFARHAAQAGKKVSLLDIVFRPFWRFFRGYILKAGFLDGWQGYVISSVAAIYTFLRYFKAFEAQLNPNGDSSS